MLDEVQLDLIPVLLGAGRRLFEELPSHVELEIVRVIDTPEATHIRAQQAPELAGNRSLVLGTLDHKVWRRSLTEPLTIPELLAQLHDFVQVVEITRSGIWGAEA